MASPKDFNSGARFGYDAAMEEMQVSAALAVDPVEELCEKYWGGVGRDDPHKCCAYGSVPPVENRKVVYGVGPTAREAAANCLAKIRGAK